MTLNFKSSHVYKPCEVRRINCIDILDNSSVAFFAVPPFLTKYWSVRLVNCHEIVFMYIRGPQRMNLKGQMDLTTLLIVPL